MVRERHPLPGWDRMWSPWSAAARIFLMLPALAVIVTGVTLVSLLPADVSTDGMWQQRDGWPAVAPPAWPYWSCTVLAVVGFAIAATWNRREVLWGSPIVGIGLAVGAFAMFLLGTRFRGLDAWPHSTVWAAAVLAVLAVAAVVETARLDRGAAARADDPAVTAR